MKGSNVIPKAGTATGRLSLRLNESAKRVCFTLPLSSLGAGAVNGASIRTGAAGHNGKVAVTLGDSISLDAINHHDTSRLRGGRLEGHDPGDPEAALPLLRDRQTTTRPRGATRGQLHK